MKWYRINKNMQGTVKRHTKMHRAAKNQKSRERRPFWAASATCLMTLESSLRLAGSLMPISRRSPSVSVTNVSTSNYMNAQWDSFSKEQVLATSSSSKMCRYDSLANRCNMPLTRSANYTCFENSTGQWTSCFTLTTRRQGELRVLRTGAAAGNGPPRRFQPVLDQGQVVARRQTVAPWVGADVVPLFAFCVSFGCLGHRLTGGDGDSTLEIPNSVEYQSISTRFQVPF